MHSHPINDDRATKSSDDSGSMHASTGGQGETAGNGTEKTPKKRLLHEDVTRGVIDSFFTVYNKLGYGFLEKVYCAAMALELRKRGHRVAREVSVPVFYDGAPIAMYKIDFLTDDVVVVEVKSTAILNRDDPRQLLNNLKATPLDVGMLLHFGPKPKFYRLLAAEHFSRS